MEPIGVASSYIGLIQVITQSLHHLRSFQKGGNRRADIESIERTLRILAHFQDAERIIGDDPELTETLSHVLVTASRELEVVARRSSRSKLQQFWKIRRDVEIEQVIESVERTLSTLQSAIFLRISTNLLKSQESLKQITDEAQQAKEDLATLKNRLPNSLGNNDNPFQLLGADKGFDTKQHELVRVRYEDTGKWVLKSNEFISWKDGKRFDSQVLWISGQPGSGKSVLMSTVIEWALERASKSKKDVVVYFYFEASRKHTARDALSSLLGQLLLKDIKLPSSISSFLESYIQPRTGTESGSSPFNLNEVTSAFLTLSREFKSVTICMDGLDECSGIQDLLRLLERVLESSCRLVVASRPWLEFHDFFEGQLNIEITERNNTDIRQYFKTFLKENPRLASMMGENLSREAEDVIGPRSNGSFVWTGLQMEQLLQLTCRAEIKEYLNSSPADLEDMYTLLLSRIKEQHPSRVELASKILTWLTTSTRLLTLSELQQAVSINTNPEISHSVFDQDRTPPISIMEEVCMGLITTEQTQDIIKLSHHSLGNLFDKNRNLKDIPEIQNPDYVVVCCIACIKTPELELGPCETVEAYKRRLSNMPIALYVAESWGFHIEQKDHVHERIEQVVDALKDTQRLNSLVQLMHVGGKPYNDQDVKQFPTDFTTTHITAYFGLELALWSEPLSSSLTENIDNQDSWGRTALHVAAGRGHLSFCAMLVKAGARMDIKDRNNRSPLHHAVLSGQYDVFERMLHFVPHNVVEEEGQALLKTAVQGGHLEIVYRLLEIEKVEAAEETVHLAAAQGDFDIVELLIGHSDFKGLDGAMLEAARQGSAREALRLFEMGADVTATDGDEKMTALHHAVVQDQAPLISRLLSIGADSEANDAKGRTPLFIGAEMGHSRVVEALLQAGAVMDVNDIRGRTPLDVAAAAGHTDIVRMLCFSGCALQPSVVALDSKGKDKQGEAEMNALQAAALGGFDEILCLLVESGSDPDTRGQTNRTPLSYAAAAGHERIVRRLLDFGADANAQDSSSRTALSYAAESGHSQIVKALLERGAIDLALSDNKGKTALAYAKERGDDDMLLLLELAESHSETRY
ncbi:hypothetical protein H9L39_07798 [Fusarium oxysporum f. sp. albedinis]|nr:hypothetical protein H9L39_07798 [Fusarium oxysporum f. sp. albedinis]